jgi:hypothetical protein
VVSKATNRTERGLFLRDLENHDGMQCNAAGCIVDKETNAVLLGTAMAVIEAG